MQEKPKKGSQAAADETPCGVIDVEVDFPSERRMTWEDYEAAYQQLGFWAYLARFRKEIIIDTSNQPFLVKMFYWALFFGLAAYFGWGK